VRVAGPGGVVPHHSSLESLDRDLDLPASGPDAGGGVLGEPADDLGRGPVLSGVVGGRDLGMQGGRQRPGLRAVDDHLDEPQSPCVGAQPPFGGAGVDVVPGDPPFVGGPVQPPPVLHGRVRTSPDTSPRSGSVRHEPGGQAGALGEVVVVDPGPVLLDIRPRGARGAAVELHPTVHALVTARQPSSNSLDKTNGPPQRRTDLRTFVACVPLGFEGLAGCGGGAGPGLVTSRFFSGQRQDVVVGIRWISLCADLSTDVPADEEMCRGQGRSRSARSRGSRQMRMFTSRQSLHDYEGGGQREARRHRRVPVQTIGP
jgi:hypothetical protein